MIRNHFHHSNKAILKALTVLVITLLSCGLVLANTGTTKLKSHAPHLQPLLESNALTYIPGNNSGIGSIAVTDNIRFQNRYGNIHINKHPIMLSAIDSVVLTKELQAVMKPSPIVIESAPIFVMIQAGQSSKTLENELITVIQDDAALHAQVTSTKTPKDCLTDTGCEADEIILQ